MLNLFALLLSLLSLLLSSVLSHILGPSPILLHIPLIAATFASLRRPFIEAASLTLVLSFLDDLLASGPPGIQQLCVTITFFLISLTARRLGGHILILGPSLVFFSSLICDLFLSAALASRYPRLPVLSLVAQSMLWSALASALFFLPYALLMGWIERTWLQRTNKNSLWT